MTSILKADTIQDAAGNNIINESGDTITIGASGDTIDIPSGATLDATGATITGALTNTPAFEAYLSSNQTLSAAAYVKAEINTEILDTAGAYDNSTNYRFTPQTAGKYFVYGNITMYSSVSTTINGAIIAIYKNGSNYKAQDVTPANSESTRETLGTCAIIDFNGSSDYVELIAYLDVDSGTAYLQSGTKYTNFGAYKIIGA